MNCAGRDICRWIGADGRMSACDVVNEYPLVGYSEGGGRVGEERRGVWVYV